MRGWQYPYVKAEKWALEKFLNSWQVTQLVSKPVTQACPPPVWAFNTQGAELRLDPYGPGWLFPLFCKWGMGPRYSSLRTCGNSTCLLVATWKTCERGQGRVVVRGRVWWHPWCTGPGAGAKQLRCSPGLLPALSLHGCRVCPFVCLLHFSCENTKCVLLPLLKFMLRKWSRNDSRVLGVAFLKFCFENLLFTLIKHLFCTKRCTTRIPQPSCRPGSSILDVHRDLTLEIWFPSLVLPLSHYCLWWKWKLQLIIQTPLGKALSLKFRIQLGFVDQESFRFSLSGSLWARHLRLRSISGPDICSDLIIVFSYRLYFEYY